jgi:hypothetical protein
MWLTTLYNFVIINDMNVSFNMANHISFMHFNIHILMKLFLYILNYLLINIICILLIFYIFNYWNIYYISYFLSCCYLQIFIPNNENIVYGVPNNTSLMSQILAPFSINLAKLEKVWLETALKINLFKDGGRIS